jgi:hypothetical protein
MSILPYARNNIQCVPGPSAISKDFKVKQNKQLISPYWPYISKIIHVLQTIHC